VTPVWSTSSEDWSMVGMHIILHLDDVIQSGYSETLTISVPTVLPNTRSICVSRTPCAVSKYYWCTCTGSVPSATIANSCEPYSAVFSGSTQ
jgi:hypothetical protein